MRGTGSPALIVGSAVTPKALALGAAGNVTDAGAAPAITATPAASGTSPAYVRVRLGEITPNCDLAITFLSAPDQRRRPAKRLICITLIRSARFRHSPLLQHPARTRHWRAIS